MKRKGLLAIVIITSLFVSCIHRNNVPESLVGLKESVAKIDSAVYAIYGANPDDNNQELEGYNQVDGFMNVTEKESFDKACKTWGKFKRLCDNEKYEDALNFYLGNDKITGKRNDGQFLIFLNHSLHRYLFFSGVLKPLMLEYKGIEFANSKYIELMSLEKELEDMTIALHAEDNGYVPEIYPLVIGDLGSALAASGKLMEAQELFNDLIHAVYGLTGDALYSNFYGAMYSAKLFEENGYNDLAIANFEDFLEHLEGHKDDYDDEEYNQCIKKVYSEIERLKE